MASEIGIVDVVGTILVSVLRQKRLSYVVGADTLWMLKGSQPQRDIVKTARLCYPTRRHPGS